jgi:acetyl esterase/lipase
LLETTDNLKNTSFLFLLFLLRSTVSFSQESPLVIPLWENGAPGFESRKNEPEQAKDWWVKNIHNPSITVFLPSKEKATGTAVVVCPGGGHRALVYNSEGRDAALFLNSLGIAAIVLKYRLAREENSPYTLEKHVKEDAYRAMRQVRSRAAGWGIDPHRVGIMGFSAGGEVAELVAYAPAPGNPVATDTVERQNGKPDFQILVYPGPLFVPDKIAPDAPPAFMVAAIDDDCCSAPVISLLQKYHDAKVPAEAHIFAQGGHAFNMGQRSKLVTLKNWSQRLTDWFTDSGLLKPDSKK